MENLARNKDCDKFIKLELKRSRIDVIHGMRRKSEVPTSITGKLGPFTFERAWYYWVVSGPVPLAVAKELYGDPVGATDIRVAGHCGCPPPKRPWITVITLDGRHVIDSQERERIEKLFRNVVDREEFERDNVFSDHIAAVGAQEFVMSYHIDSEIGLRLFADTIRKHGFDKC